MQLGAKFIPSLVLLWIMVCTSIQAKMSSSMLESILLINLQELNEISGTNDNQNRRSALTSEQIDEKLASNTLPSLSDYLATRFDTSHSSPLETNNILTQSLSEGFALESPPSIEDFIVSLDNLVEFKDGTNTPNKSFLSATKSLISAYLRAGGTFDEQDNLPLILYDSILPKIKDWAGGTADLWVKNISQLTVEAFLEEDRSMDELSTLSSSFASTTIELVSNQLDIDSIDIDYLEADEDLTLEDKINSNQNYAPSQTKLIQQLSIGITQGYLGFNDFESDEKGLTSSDFASFSKSESTPTPSNGGKIENNIITGFMNGLLNSATALGETKEIFLYDSIKAAANGFLLSATVATTSKPEYFDTKLHLEASQMLSKQILQSLILHNGSTAPTMAIDWIDVGRASESAALGSAMGAQLGTVLLKSQDYSSSWEIFPNSRREIAKAVSTGSSYGAVNASSWLSTLADPNQPNDTILNSEDVQSISRGVSTGSMIGATGLASYYPTDQFDAIINFTAQGSSIGSLSAENLALVKPISTESIDISIARESSFGSSMGAAFEPTVILGLNPAIVPNDLLTIDHLTAASFGATFGAILGISGNDPFIENVSSIPSTAQGSNNIATDNINLIQIKQAAKQGSIEGALAGLSLALDIDQPNNDNLLSKASILKAINRANINASANATPANVSSNFRTDPKDMLLLMKKFGINPRYTNPAKMYKRPVIVQIDEPTIDDETADAINNASPL